MKKLITLQDVEKAARTKTALDVDSHTIVTPYALDRAKELGVPFNRVSETSQDGYNSQKLDEQNVKMVAIGADHGGYALKETLKTFLKSLGYSVLDLGTDSPESCDYPDFAFQVAEAVAKGKAQRGIMIDSVGIGSAMAANRVPGVLAAKCNNTTEAQSAREHNYANVLTLGAKIIGTTLAQEIVKTFLETRGGAERHQRRVNKILGYMK